MKHDNIERNVGILIILTNRPGGWSLDISITTIQYKLLSRHLYLKVKIMCTPLDGFEKFWNKKIIVP
jgi:hypothetical protein